MKNNVQNKIIIEVPTGEVKTAKAPAFLQCLALGSCVAVILYDEKRKIGGIAHVLLPSRAHYQNDGDKSKNLLKHTNYAIYELVKQMKGLGAMQEVLTAQIVGGALVIPDSLDIGKENIKSVRKILEELNIKIIGEHLGGNAGRSALFDVNTGELQINGKAFPVDTIKNFSTEKDKEKNKHSPEYLFELEKKIEERTTELNKKIEELENIRKVSFNLLEDLEKEREILIKSKEIEETSVKNLEKFKLALDNTSEQVVISDSEGTVIYANTATEKITGYSPAEALGKKSGVLWKKPMPDEFYQKLWNTIKVEKKQFIGEIENRRKNGEMYIASMNVSPILNSKNEIIYFVSVERDITKEKEIDRAKTEFVSLASHQLRTPLTTIKWYSEMILKGDVGEVVPDQKKYLEEIYKGNQRMIELVNTLLDVSRIELGTLKTQAEEIDIVSIIKNIIDELKLKIEEKKIILNQKFNENIPKLQNDPKLIRMVFQNIISNAVTYTPNEGSITIEIEKSSPENILIKISDTGYGIPRKQQDQIFTKLFRADNIREKDTVGTGLGLYISKSIVENSGGKIYFESEENKGTTFFIELPLKKSKIKENKI